MQVVDHFDKYPLLSQKRADFELFKQVINLILRQEHLTNSGLQEIVNLKASMNFGVLSENLLISFPNAVAVSRPLVKEPAIYDPEWVSGFVSGEGCFFVNIYKRKDSVLGEGVKLVFKITQDKRNSDLLARFLEIFGCGGIYNQSKSSSGNVIDFMVTYIMKITKFWNKQSLTWDNFHLILWFLRPFRLIVFIAMAGYVGVLFFLCFDSLNYFCPLSFVPVVTYSNAALNKSRIIRENRLKSGVHQWTNTRDNLRIAKLDSFFFNTADSQLFSSCVSSRYSSSSSPSTSSNKPNISVVVYNNADIQKLQILKENKNKSGVYIWKNLTNGKRYVGSSVDIRGRMYSYYSAKYLSSQKSMRICTALLKHGYSLFCLEIIEYCEPDKCVEREGYWIKLLEPEYNISLDPRAPMLGREHPDETRKKMSDAAKKIEHSGRFKKGDNHLMFGKTHSDETRKKMSDTQKGRDNRDQNQPHSQKIEVIDQETNERTYHDSINAAARALDIKQPIIVKYFSRNQQKPYKGRYIFKKVG